MTETVTPAALVVLDTPAATDDKAPVVAESKAPAEKAADFSFPPLMALWLRGCAARSTEA